MLVLAVAATAVVMANGSKHHGKSSPSVTQPESKEGTESTETQTTPPGPPPAPARYAVGVQILKLVDETRTVPTASGGTEPRPLTTIVRYPVLAPPAEGDKMNAAPASKYGPFPLIVFGHGFNVTPATYTKLLESWASAGYIVAAPIFPLENADHPGGADEADLTNQPADMTFVISSLLEASAAPNGPFSGLVDPAHIAVAGQSDGGDTALAVAYDANYRDKRVDAAVVLSGAEIPGLEAIEFPVGGPPLLAVQGTADIINKPAETYAFFAAAHPPKFLLKLYGAEHLPPYASEQPQLGLVEKVTTAFFNAYLKGDTQLVGKLSALGTVGGVAALQSEP